MTLTASFLITNLVLFSNIQDAITLVTRIEKFNVKKQTGMSNPYRETQLSGYHSIICSLMCFDDPNCLASSLSKSNFLCQLYGESSGAEIVDLDKVLLGRNLETQTTTEVPATTQNIPTKWPQGTYTLMKPATGCPGVDVTWKEGSRYHDTEDDHRLSGYTFTSNMAVDHDTYKNIRVNFCTKDVDDSGRTEWPPGNYCILEYIACPTGFVSGYIQWDDEDTANANTAQGTLPKGNFNHDTTVYYCCRNDGTSDIAIYLPITSPFYLLRFTDLCQTVYGMQVSEEIIEWDCEEGGFNNVGIVHPYEDGSLNNVALHFCYYYI